MSNRAGPLVRRRTMDFARRWPRVRGVAAGRGASGAREGNRAARDDRRAARGHRLVGALGSSDRRVDEAFHAIQVVYRVQVTGGELRDGIDGSADAARWFTLAETGALPLVDLARLGVSRHSRPIGLVATTTTFPNARRASRCSWAAGLGQREGAIDDRRHPTGFDELEHHVRAGRPIEPRIVNWRQNRFHRSVSAIRPVRPPQVTTRPRCAGWPGYGARSRGRCARTRRPRRARR